MAADGKILIKESYTKHTWLAGSSRAVWLQMNMISEAWLLAGIISLQVALTILAVYCLLQESTDE